MRLWRGLDLRVGGVPRQEIGSCAVPAVIGLVGSDYPDLRLKALVEPGAAVACGDPVLEDRHDRRLRVVAPVAGEVQDVLMGPRRQVSALTIRREGDAVRDFAGPAATDTERLKELLLASGLWCALLRRPFGRIPSPDDRPDAIFVTATDSEPNAPDPRVAIDAAGAGFRRAVGALALLTDGPIFVCQDGGSPLAETTGQVRIARFGGPHPAGLAGTHIETLFPLIEGRSVWQIGYADVLALGHLLESGKMLAERIVALGGPLARDPRLVRVPIGADIAALAAAEAKPGSRRVLSGSALSGTESRFLKRRHRQITLMPRQDDAGAWHVPLATGRLKRAPLVPHAALEQALGPHPAPVPLLRALSANDAGQAARLGAAGLLEEDVALATYLSGGVEDFAQRLREVLSALAEAQP